MNYYLYKINQILSLMTGKDTTELLDEISTRIVKDGDKVSNITQIEQGILAGILGSMLHSAYCNGRRLSAQQREELSVPLEIANNPRMKVLGKELDAEFVQKVLSGEIPQSPTLFVDKKGNVVMDIANRQFVELSPYWQKENFNAGEAAVRLVVANWDALKGNNPKIKEWVTYAVSTAIHEAWLARDNVYREETDEAVYTNAELDTAFNQLTEEEQKKDSIQLDMAMSVMDQLMSMVHDKQQKMEGSQPQSN